jgi:hypothetical protein
MKALDGSTRFRADELSDAQSTRLRFAGAPRFFPVPILEIDVVQPCECDGTPDGLRTAIELDPPNPILAAHFGKALADRARAKKTDPRRSSFGRSESA